MSTEGDSFIGSGPGQKCYGHDEAKNILTLWAYASILRPTDRASLFELSISNTARVYTADDKTIQTPNSDTPYSFVGADLRAEPLVFTVPEIEKDRYYSLQFIDIYTFNFGYVGNRTTGNGAGSYLLAGPKWSAKPRSTTTSGQAVACAWPGPAAKNRKNS
jgi:hypothetical protein